VRNITDPDSRLMPTRGGGFGQCYNTENVISGDEPITATELTDDPAGMAWFGPMMTRAEALALADSGYCSEANLTCPGPDRLIAVGKRRDLEKAARGGDTGGDWGGPAVQAMRERLRTPEGIEAYRHRGHIAETPHGHIKHNMGIRQLSMRGKAKAAAEWTFICAVHNLFKAITTGHLTPQALAALPS
jgi:hypothetical protein